MPWQREAEFKEVLDKAVKKGSKGAIATAQTIALEDMGQCYKHVCILVERQMRRAKPAQRLNALYIISTICRHSLKKHKLQDKYTGRWGPSIASLVELLADLPAQMAQVEKVLASWKKEKIFSEAIVDQCASNIGLTIATSGLFSVPSAAAAADVDNINIPSPAISAFSEPSAGSVDLEALDSFPPKTVASANTELPRAAEPATIPPASNASTGSSRPPEPPKPSIPADLYDPFAAESYDYDPFGSDYPPAERPHVLPLLPSMAPASLPECTTAANGDAAPAAPPVATQATDKHPSHLGSLANGIVVHEEAGSGGSRLPAPPAVDGLSLPPLPLPGQPGSSSRKRKSRWEDAAPASSEPVANAAFQADHTIADTFAAVLEAPAAEPAEAKPKPRRSKFSDAPPVRTMAPLQSGRGSTQLALPAAADSTQPDPSLPLPPAGDTVLPPKPASARQDGEAQAAAALEAVEQMLQAKRHSEARNNAPSTYRSKQPLPPLHQPPLPRPPRPQPPLPQLPPPQPAFTEGPGTSSGHAGSAWHPGHAGHAMPPFHTGPPAGFPGQQSAFPHLPPMLQHGLQRSMQPPHLGHLAPQQFVQAGIQPHHRPAPPHHLPSILQHQPPPPQRDMSHLSGPQLHPHAPQLQPQRQANPPMARQQSFEQPSQQLNRPLASSQQNSTEADLGHFQTTSIAMDTPTDTGPDSSWRLLRAQPNSSRDGGTSDAPGDRNVATTLRPHARDDLIPAPPPSPPAAQPAHQLPSVGAAVPPPPPPPPAPTGTPPESSGGLSHPYVEAAAAAVPEAADASLSNQKLSQAVLVGESRSTSPTSSEAATLDTSGQPPKAPHAAFSAKSLEDAHAAAPAGPVEKLTDQREAAETTKDSAERLVAERATDDEMDMSE